MNDTIDSLSTERETIIGMIERTEASLKARGIAVPARPAFTVEGVTLEKADAANADLYAHSAKLKDLLAVRNQSKQSAATHSKAQALTLAQRLVAITDPAERTLFWNENREALIHEQHLSRLGR